MLTCRHCGDDAIITGPAPVIVSGVPLLVSAVHAATGRELGADGHVIAPLDRTTAEAAS
jgi:hypothetical protein